MNGRSCGSGHPSSCTAYSRSARSSHTAYAPRPKGTPGLKAAASKQEGHSSGQPRLAPVTDVTLRAAAVVLVIAGAAVGFGQPIAIALVAVGPLCSSSSTRPSNTSDADPPTEPGSAAGSGR